MINELNALSISQGITNPIHLWVNVPYRGLCSIDPDYSLGSNWAVNLVTTALNGSTLGGVTYSGLTAAANIFVEYSNEIWNYGPSDFPGNYLIHYGASRWYPALYPPGGNFEDPHALRATCMSRDIKAAFPGNNRIKTIIGLQSADGFAAGSFHGNYDICFGSSTKGHVGYYYTTDSTVVSESWGTPISNVDAICIAAYLNASGTYWSTSSGTGTLTDDSARYNGTDNSGRLTFVGGTGGTSD